jgi:2-keto-4-pentenoate hydratase
MPRAFSGMMFYMGANTNMTIDVKKAARLLLEVRATGVRISELPDDCRPTNLDEAYAIQAEVQGQLKDATEGAVIGYKVGAAADGAMKNFGLEEPFAGTLLDQFMLESPAGIPSDGCFVRVIECEYAFKMADDFLPAAAPYDLDAIVAGVASLVLSIEVVDSRYIDSSKVGGLQVIADSGGAGYWVKGQEIIDFHDIDFEDASVSLLVNGEECATGQSSNVYGSPLNSLAWLINHVCLSGREVKAGHYITVGTFNAPMPVNPGDYVIADFGQLGKVEVGF